MVAIVVVMKTVVQLLSFYLHDLAGNMPPGLPVCVAAAFVGGGKYFAIFRKEIESTFVMMLLTFQMGNWYLRGPENELAARCLLGLAIVVVDYLNTGGHTNAVVTVGMMCLNKCSYTEGYVRIAGQIAGGLIAFPFFHAVADTLNLHQFGGPVFTVNESDSHATKAFLCEFLSTFWLMLVIYFFSWGVNFGYYHRLIKQSFTAVCILIIISIFRTTGPGMNPTLATSWYVFGVGTTYEYPKEFSHYFVFWIAPMFAALVSSFLYAIYDEGIFCGDTIIERPLKERIRGYWKRQHA